MNKTLVFLIPLMLFLTSCFDSGEVAQQIEDSVNWKKLKTTTVFDTTYFLKQGDTLSFQFEAKEGVPYRLSLYDWETFPYFVNLTIFDSQNKMVSNNETETGFSPITTGLYTAKIYIFDHITPPLEYNINLRGEEVEALPDTLNGQWYITSKTIETPCGFTHKANFDSEADAAYKGNRFRYFYISDNTLQPHNQFIYLNSLFNNQNTSYNIQNDTLTFKKTITFNDSTITIISEYCKTEFDSDKLDSLTSNFNYQYTESFVGNWEVCHVEFFEEDDLEDTSSYWNENFSSHLEKRFIRITNDSIFDYWRAQDNTIHLTESNAHTDNAFYINPWNYIKGDTLFLVNFDLCLNSAAEIVKFKKFNKELPTE